MNKKIQIHWSVSIVAILCLTVIEIFAMHYGINGLMRSIIFALIAGIVGLTIPLDKFIK